MKIKEFIEKCEKSENLEMNVKHDDEYQIKIVGTSKDVKKYIKEKLLSLDEEGFIENYIMVGIYSYYGDILLYKIDDIIEAVTTSENYDIMFEKLEKINVESRRKRRHSRIYVSSHSKYGVRTGVNITFNPETYSRGDNTKVKLTDEFVGLLVDLGIGYERIDNTEVRIDSKKCNQYSESKMWCKDTHQKEEFDKLFGF